MSMHKTAAVLFVLIAGSTFISAQADGADNAPQELFDSDDIDSLFEDSEDIHVEEQDAADPAGSQALTITVADYSVPLKFSGSLDAELGGFLTNERKTQNKDVSPSLLFSLTNYLNFMARIDKTLAVRGSTSVSFPPSKNIITLEELYFDYLIFDRIYITAGKKETAWGYTRLFSDENAYNLYTDKDYDSLTEAEKEEFRREMEKQGALFTNILSDSKSSVSGLMRIPLWTGTLSGIVLYNGASTEPKADEISVAGSVEMTFFHTSFNIFGRKDPRRDDGVQPVIAGAEAKKTVFGTDLYIQGIGKLTDEKDDFSKCVFTGGFYRLWDGHDPNFGINVEFQDSYNKLLKKNSCRVYVDMGLKRLGKNKDMKIGLQWQHIIKSETNDDKSGLVKLAFIKSGLFPHADWETGIEVRYHPADEEYRNKMHFIRLGSSVSIQVNY